MSTLEQAYEDLCNCYDNWDRALLLNQARMLAKEFLVRIQDSQEDSGSAEYWGKYRLPWEVGE